MFQNILVATDGSELSDKALATALTLAKANGGNVTVVTVTEPVSAGLNMASFGGFEAAGVIARVEDAYAEIAHKTLGNARKKAQEQGMTIQALHVPDSATADAIISTAQKQGCDAIVMGSHGRRGLGRLLLGSQAAEVLARSTLPVLIVK